MRPRSGDGEEFKIRVRRTEEGSPSKKEHQERRMKQRKGEKEKRNERDIFGRLKKRKKKVLSEKPAAEKPAEIQEASR